MGKVIEKIDQEEVIEQVAVKFLGNYKEFINGEVYEMPMEEAAPYITLGYARIVN